MSVDTGRKALALVAGLGISGRSAARLLISRGWSVRAVDDREVEPCEGVTMCRGEAADLFEGVSLVVASPGLKADHPVLVRAEALGLEIVGEVELAAAGLQGDVIGITGTNGKSTVTHFTGLLCEAALPGRTFVGGNLGKPLCDGVREGGFERYVVELSSYQLERVGSLAPKAAVILNLTPDHLARHGSMDGYAVAKLNIAKNMGARDCLFLPADDARLQRLDPGRGQRAFLGRLPGVVREGRRAHIRVGEIDHTLDLSAFQVAGAHNLDHAATATALTLWAGAPFAAVQAAISTLTALSHRMEIVCRDGGVTWIDDSKATNPEAAAVGMGGLTGPVIALLGGQAKKGGFDALCPAVLSMYKVITFGADGPAIAQYLRSVGREVVESGSMQDAVACARAYARPGDTVLLSPATASFDAFDNFEHRGRVFAALARGERVP